MPGPSNGRKKRKSGRKTQKKEFAIASQNSRYNNTNASFGNIQYTASVSSSPSPSCVDIITEIYNATPEHERQPRVYKVKSPIHNIHRHALEYVQESSDFRSHGIEIDSRVLFREPYIHDEGNGPRVKDTRAFLASRYFSQPPALDDPLCAEFAQEEVLQMLKTVLPEELALILWYNKSRASSRICPVCQRLYRVGDVLPDHTAMTGSAKPGLNPLRPPAELGREQVLSGICSSMCFIIASFNQCDPRTTKAAWGHTANDIDDESWAILNGGSPLLLKEGPGQNAAKALVMIVRMTRLDDLGLAQLCFPDVNWEGLDESEERL